jgi:hypothetical protein
MAISPSFFWQFSHFPTRSVWNFMNSRHSSEPHIADSLLRLVAVLMAAGHVHERIVSLMVHPPNPLSLHYNPEMSAVPHLGIRVFDDSNNP